MMTLKHGTSFLEIVQLSNHKRWNNANKEFLSMMTLLMLFCTGSIRF